MRSHCCRTASNSSGINWLATARRAYSQVAPYTGRIYPPTRALSCASEVRQVHRPEHLSTTPRVRRSFPVALTNTTILPNHYDEERAPLGNQLICFECGSDFRATERSAPAGALLFPQTSRTMRLPLSHTPCHAPPSSPGIYVSQHCLLLAHYVAR